MSIFSTPRAIRTGPLVIPDTFDGEVWVQMQEMSPGKYFQIIQGSIVAEGVCLSQKYDYAKVYLRVPPTDIAWQNWIVSVVGGDRIATTTEEDLHECLQNNQYLARMKGVNIHCFVDVTPVGGDIPPPMRYA